MTFKSNSSNYSIGFTNNLIGKIEFDNFCLIVYFIIQIDKIKCNR